MSIISTEDGLVYHTERVPLSAKSTTCRPNCNDRRAVAKFAESRVWDSVPERSTLFWMYPKLSPSLGVAPTTFVTFSYCANICFHFEFYSCLFYRDQGLVIEVNWLISITNGPFCVCFSGIQTRLLWLPGYVGRLFACKFVNQRLVGMIVFQRNTRLIVNSVSRYVFYLNAFTLLIVLKHSLNKCLPSQGWLGSRVVSVLDSGTEGAGFKSQPRRCRVVTRQTVHTHCDSVHQAEKMVAALLRVAGVTAGLAESNGSLQPGL